VCQNAAKISTLRDLIGKRVGVVANSGGAAVVETYNKNRVGGSHFYQLLYCAIVNKDDESLYKAVNQAITQIRYEGTLESIL
jgi:ABC-type amino acid transport substrate-binding protein